MLYSHTTPETQGTLNQAHQAPSMWKDMNIFLPGTYIFPRQLPRTLASLWTQALLPKIHKTQEEIRRKENFTEDQRKRDL